MKRLLNIAFFVLLLPVAVLEGCTPGEVRTYAPQTRREAREAARRDLREVKIEETQRGPLTAKTEKAWLGSFWAMGLMRYRSESTDSAIRRSLQDFSIRSPSFQRGLLEVVYTLYPSEFIEPISRIADTVENEKLFAMCGWYLRRAQGPASRQSVIDLLTRRFPGYADHPILFMLNDRLSGSFEKYELPPLADLLSSAGGAGASMVFSFQRRDRRFHGLAVVRDETGRFVRNADGTLFAVPQLALSDSDLPGFLTNGNTPQGILSFQGFAVSKNQYIGPTENLQLVLPYEADVPVFFHDAQLADTEWSREQYGQLLPPSWRGYTPVYEAFYAGKAGRTEIIAHGTTIDPFYSRGQPFYPNAPTQGCLSAQEEWSEETGERVRSDQARLTEALRRAGGEKAYVVVVEIGAESADVALAEIQHALLEAERRAGL